MRPALVKNRDTSLPWSARRAMTPAGIGFRGLRMFFIKFLLLFRGFPESHEVCSAQDDKLEVACFGPARFI
jgi:hypothetical protein